VGADAAGWGDAAGWDGAAGVMMMLLLWVLERWDPRQSARGCGSSKGCGRRPRPCSAERQRCSPSQRRRSSPAPTLLFAARPRAAIWRWWAQTLS
jgi:hypothetical protein